jgi:hypothetical protein
VPARDAERARKFIEDREKVRASEVDVEDERPME